MWEDLKRIFDHLSRDESIRAVVLSAAGPRAFSAGLDVKWAASDTSTFSPAANDTRDGARRAVAIRRGALDFQDCISAIEKCEKPVICVLHGLALGISIDISTCADIRICTSDVRFSVKEVDIGLAADVGTLSRLPKVVGHYGWVKEVSMTAREFGAEEALRVGFVNRVLPTKEEAIKSAFELAVFLATKSPVAVQGTKEFLDHARDHTVADSELCLVWFVV
jgi:delta(3,5)-delta(2,4)-dienoyl-CoA isomerase